TNMADKTNVDYTYNPATDNSRTVQEKAELCARIAYAAISDPNINSTTKTQLVANWIQTSSESMSAAITNANKTKTSYASNYATGQGYSASQWNEYVGTVSFANSADIDKNGTKDKAIYNINGTIAGFDLNSDGTLQDNEKVISELNQISTKSTSSTISFLG
ncbi:MAG: hypothetical protein WC197_08560, partial [Candidatus Gastranaerophilaceae bacterium]